MAKCQYEHNDYQCELNAEYIEYNRNHTEEERELCYFHYLSMACDFIKYKGTFEKPYNTNNFINNDSDLIGVVNTKFPDLFKNHDLANGSIFRDKLQNLLSGNNEVVLKDIYLPAFEGLMFIPFPIIDSLTQHPLNKDYLDINSRIELEIYDLVYLDKVKDLKQQYDNASIGEAFKINNDDLFYSSASDKVKDFHYTFGGIRFNNKVKISGNIAIHIGGCQFNDITHFECTRLTILDSTVAADKEHIIIVPFVNLYLSKSIGDNNYLFEKAKKIHFFDGYNSHLGQLEKSYDHTTQNKETGKGYFHGVELNNAIFHDSFINKTHKIDRYPDNLKKIEFVNCKFNDGHKLYEKDVHPKRLEYSYRYLRKHFDEKGDYIEGNDFHYNYMEAKKKSSSLWDKLWLYPYGWINGYNTKPGRTIIAILTLIILATIINTCYGNFIIKDMYDTVINKHDWHSSFIYSAANIIPIINKDTFIPKGTITLQLTMLENLFGPILIALLLMALRNRFRRSKTPEEIKEN